MPRILLPVLFATLAATAAAAGEPVRAARVSVEEPCAAAKVPVIVKSAHAAAVGCASAAAPQAGRAHRVPLHTPAYTPRFLPGFAVTVDRAHAVWSGFVAGVGQSLASGRNCFASSCGASPQLQLDSGSFAPEPAMPEVGAAPARQYATLLVPAGVPDVGGVEIAQSWSATPWRGAAPIEVRIAAARNVYRWGTAGADYGLAAPARNARPQDTARGRSVSLELRGSRLAFEAAEHRFRLDAVPAFAAAYDTGTLRRRDLRVTLQASGVQLSAALADTTAVRAGGDSERVAWLAVRLPLD